MRPQRVTVLGASGFIGSALVRDLRKQGITCLACTRTSPPPKNEALGHVVYAIGLTADFRQRPLETAEAHVCVLRQLLADADFESLTYLSSTRVYQPQGPTHESSTLSVQPQRLDDLYNLSKMLGESLCLQSGRAGVQVARLSNVVGLRKDKDIFIDQILEEIVRTRRLRLHSSLDSAKDYIDISDVVSALVGLIGSGAEGVFNIASGAMTSHRTVLEHIRRVLEFELEAHATASPASDPVPIDTTHLFNTTGFQASAFNDFFPTYLTRYMTEKGTT
jgi:nucleoside-diphosphate-sugar epimerase